MEEVRKRGQGKRAGGGEEEEHSEGCQGAVVHLLLKTGIVIRQSLILGDSQ